MNWLRRLIVDMMLEVYKIIEVRLNTIDMMLDHHKEQLDSLSVILSSIDAQIKELKEVSVGRENLAEQASTPLQSSRGSWPRMRKHFEEADVRKILADRHVDSLEEYWKAKNSKNQAQGDSK